MAKKRKTKKSTVKRSKRSTRDVDVFAPDVSDEALERAGAGAATMGCTLFTQVASCGSQGCVIVAVDNLKMLISLRPNKKA